MTKTATIAVATRIAAFMVTCAASEVPRRSQRLDVHNAPSAKAAHNAP